MWQFVACLFCLTAPGLAGRSPNADLIEEHYGKLGGYSRYSNNLLEDSILDVPSLIHKYGYPIEVHTVTTEDGYVLEMHRIKHGRDKNNKPDPSKPVVLVVPGLFSSSAVWVFMGPGSGLGYILAEAGFDVWLGNVRGTHYSKKHILLDPVNNATREQFWKFSFEEIGRFDLPVMIDRILEVTGKSRIHYVGHSQGTLAFWSMSSLRPEYNEKIISMQALAPVAYMQKVNDVLLELAALLEDGLEATINSLGKYDVLPNSPFFTMIGHAVCGDEGTMQLACSNMLLLTVGTHEDMLNATMFPVILGHTPAGASVRQLIHVGQLIGKDRFSRFDHGTKINQELYNSRTPPPFELSKVKVPVYLHYVDHDPFANLMDVDRLWKELPSAFKMRVPHATFGHLDFMWGTRAKSLVYDPAINFMLDVGKD